MIRIESDELLKMGEQYQQRKEITVVNLDAYIVKGRPYYLAIYQRKFMRTGDTGCAILSNEGGNQEDALRSLRPHVYYGVTNNTMMNIGRQRASLSIDPLVSMKKYLKTIIDAGVLKQGDQTIYERAHDTLHGMEELQGELVKLSEKADRLYESVQKRGYFTDEDAEKSFQFVPMLNLIQYKQMKDRYIYRTDFDLVYQNRKDAEIKRVAPAIDAQLLKNMTSKIAGPDMKETLEVLEEGANFDHKPDEFLLRNFTSRLKKGLDDYVEYSKSIMRHPVVGDGKTSKPLTTGQKQKPTSNMFFWLMMVLLLIIIISFM